MAFNAHTWGQQQLTYIALYQSPIISALCLLMPVQNKKGPTCFTQVQMVNGPLFGQLERVNLAHNFSAIGEDGNQLLWMWSKGCYNTSLFNKREGSSSWYSNSHEKKISCGGCYGSISMQIVCCCLLVSKLLERKSNREFKGWFLL